MKYVYLARSGNDYKVGIAINVTERIKQLQTSNPYKIEVVTTRLVDDAYYVEQATHKFMEHAKSGGGREWFTLTPEQAIELAIAICRNPEIDMSYPISIAEVINRQNAQHKVLDEKVTLLLNKIQVPKKDIRTVTQIPDLPLPARPKLTNTNLNAKSDDDRLANTAMEIFRRHGKASTSLMQRELRIGYGKAARIMDKLELEGKISRWDGQAVRDVLA